MAGVTRPGQEILEKTPRGLAAGGLFLFGINSSICGGMLPVTNVICMGGIVTLQAVTYNSSSSRMSLSWLSRAAAPTSILPSARFTIPLAGIQQRRRPRFVHPGRCGPQVLSTNHIPLDKRLPLLLSDKRRVRPRGWRVRFGL